MVQAVSIKVVKRIAQRDLQNKGALAFIVSSFLIKDGFNSPQLAARSS